MKFNLPNCILLVITAAICLFLVTYLHAPTTKQQGASSSAVDSASKAKAIAPMGVTENKGAIGLGEERLEVLAEDDAGPWSLKDGTGFANDVVKAAFAAAGVDIELQVVPYARGRQMVAKGTAAACFSMSWLPEYADKIVFPDEPLFTCQCDYFHNLNKPLAAKSQEEITRKIIVGTVIGYEYPSALRHLRDQGFIVLEETPSEELNLKKLVAGRIDAALINYNTIKTAESTMARAGVAGKVGQAFHCGELRSFIGFSQAHPRGLWARDKFNAGFRIIDTNGTRLRIEKAWAAKVGLEMGKTTGLSSGTDNNADSQGPGGQH